MGFWPVISVVVVFDYMQLVPITQKAFLKATEEAKVLPVKPNNADMGKLYGLYKQATMGDVNIGQSLSCKRKYSHC